MAESSLNDKHFERLSECVFTNGNLLQQIAMSSGVGFGAPEDPELWSQADSTNMEKVVSTLRQLVREWSEEGAAERNLCFGVVINELEQLFPDKSKRNSVKIVVPGCGLGRLPLELAARGFQAQGNEFSFHMLFTSNFMLNMTQFQNQYLIHPYIHSVSQQKTRDYQTRGIKIPDVHPGELLERSEQKGYLLGELSMVSGSFDDVYLNSIKEEEEQGQFQTVDVVTTVFFIDTAPNIFRTLDAISSIIKSGGYWINFGPLLWHYEDTAEVASNNESIDEDDDKRTQGLELTAEEVLSLLPKYGFELIKHQSEIPCTYTMDVLGMGGYIYKCEYWLARKL